MGKKIEGYWDCPQCGKKANKGRYRNCPGCGRPRGASTKFYMIEKDNFVPESVVPKGPDWFCECCESYNTFGADFCTSCGAPKGAAKNYFEVRKEQENRPKAASVPSSFPETTSPLEARTENHSNYGSSVHDEPKYKATSSNNHEEDVPSQLEEPHEDPVSHYSSQANSYSARAESSRNSDWSYSVSSSHGSFFDTISDFFGSIGSFFSNNWSKILIALLVVAAIGGIVYAVIPKEVSLHITELSWKRTIDIEEYKTVRESAWSVPAGGRLQYTREEIRSYRQVLDHYETVAVQKSETYISGYTTHTDYIDLGNGYFDSYTYSEPEYSTRYWTEYEEEPVYRSEPVYDTKYYYDIDKWVYARQAVSSGFTSENSYEMSIPMWPELNLKSNERSSTKYENYVVSGYNTKDKKQNIKNYSISYDYWNRLRVGEVHNCTITLSGITKIEGFE